MRTLVVRHRDVEGLSRCGARDGKKVSDTVVLGRAEQARAHAQMMTSASRIVSSTMSGTWTTWPEGTASQPSLSSSSPTTDVVVLNTRE